MRRLSVLSIALILGATLLAATHGQPRGAAEEATALVGVDVVTMTDGRLLRNQTVIVAGKSITALGDAATTRPPASARTIDGRGRVLIPGLTDAHVHLMDRSDLGQFLAFGVTTIRHLLGSDEILRWKKEVAAGTLAGPRIVASGPTFAGASIPWKNKVVVADPDAARAEVRRQQGAGYDVIKVYDGVTAPVYDAILDEAKRLGMPVTGHIPADVHLAGVLRARQNLEHVDKTVFDVWGHTFDPARIDSVARAIKAGGVFVTPTIASMEQLARIGSGRFDSLLARTEARRTGDVTFKFWCDVTSRLAGNRPPREGVRFDPWADFQLKLIAALHRAGVPLVAGTDYPNAVMSAGGGLIEELVALTDAGLSNLDALRTATTNAARAIGDSTAGFVGVGARADLVLLRQNPLDDLRALHAIEGVMTAGSWRTREELDLIAPPRAGAMRCAPR